MDDGVSYSAFGMIELKLLSDHLGLCRSVELDPVLRTFNGYSQRKYGTETHASVARKIPGSIMIKAQSDNRHCDKNSIPFS